MAKTKDSNSDLLTGAAEVVGGALGTIAGTIDRLKADHPHPAEEAKEALAAGQAQLTGLAATARDRASTVIKATQTAITKVRKQAGQSRRKGKAIVRKAKGATRKTVRKARKAVGRGRKTAARSRARARRK